MKPIGIIKLIKMSIQGFKGFVNIQTFNFDNTSIIEADNGQGKSSILEAIIYAFTGCTQWGDNKNERLVNIGAKKAHVEVTFTDENNTTHILSRRRTSSGSSIAFNGIPVRQADLNEAFGEKDCFLSMVNPLYFIEQMADSNGRDFLLKLLPFISHESVMLSLNEYHRSVLEEDNLLEPVTYIKNCRQKIRELEDNKTYNQGQIDMLNKKTAIVLPSIDDINSAIEACNLKLQKIEEGRHKPYDKALLEERKLTIQAEIKTLQQSRPDIKDCTQLEIQLSGLQDRYSQLQQQKYVSGLTELLGTVDSELQKLRNEWNRLDSLIGTISPGSICPSCMHNLTNESVEYAKSVIKKEKTSLKSSAEPLTKKREWLVSQDNEAKNNFEERLEGDIKACENVIAELTRKIQTLKLDNTSTTKEFEANKNKGISELQKKLSDIDFKIKNLDENYNKELVAYETTTAKDKNDLNATIEEYRSMKHSVSQASNSAQEAALLSENIRIFDESINNLNQKIEAALEYAAKRAELTLKPLKMNRVDIKLQELVKSTGEIVNTFRFTYNGRDYRLLSLSEKLRAGLEVSGLIQELCGKCFPILVDNSESITVIDNLDIPGQVIFSRVVPGATLSVKSIPPCQESTLLPLRKAG